jgi:hypothetical protein
MAFELPIALLRKQEYESTAIGHTIGHTMGEGLAAALTMLDSQAGRPRNMPEARFLRAGLPALAQRPVRRGVPAPARLD